MLWHDQQYVWFVPKVAPSKHWVAKILVEVLVAHDLADIGKKSELELARVHWHAKKMATIQTKTNLWVMTKILVRCTLATIQTHPNIRLVDDARGAATRVSTPIPSHIDLAGNTSYHFAASRTVSHGCRLTMVRDRLRLLAHVYDSVASIHMTRSPC